MKKQAQPQELLSGRGTLTSLLQRPPAGRGHSLNSWVPGRWDKWVKWTQNQMRGVLGAESIGGHLSCGTSGKDSTCQYRRHKRCGFDPWVGKIPWRWKWHPTPVFLPENPMDGGAWQATVHGIAKSQTRLSDFTLHFSKFFLCLLKCQTNKKKIFLKSGRPWFDPWVGKIPWRRTWQPTPVFLPGESHGWRSMVGYSPPGRKELDMTERFHIHFTFTV